MGNLYDQRRKNVIKIIHEKFGGSKKAFSDRVGETPATISKVTVDNTSRSYRTIRTNKAREWEPKVGLPDGWLDKPHDECVAYALLSVKPKETKKIVKDLKLIPEIKEATAITGPHDIIIKIVADDNKHLGRIIMDKIRIDSVTDTVTYAPVEGVEGVHWKRE